MKKISILVLLAGVVMLARAMPAQTVHCQTNWTPQCQDTQTISTSGGSATFVGNGGAFVSVAEAIAGTPATVSIVVQGGDANNVYTTLDTYTTVANATRKPTIDAPYDHYKVTATWTGGSSVSVTITTIESTAALHGGSGLPGWTSTGSGSSQVDTAPGTIAASTAVVNQLTSNTPNSLNNVASVALNPSRYYALGDSITACYNVTNPTNCYANRLGNLIGVTAGSGYGVGGDQACDTSAKAFNTLSPSAQPQQPLVTVMIGSNDANGPGVGAHEATFNTCDQAMMAWLAIPVSFKVAGSTATPTGTCASDTTYSQITGEKCTASGSSLSFSVTTHGGPIYIWPRYIDSDAGIWTYSVDGGTAVPVSTALASAISTANGLTTAPGFIRITGIAAGSHTVLFTQTHSGTMAIVAVGTPSNLPASSNPYLVMGNIPNQLDGNIQSTINAYNADVLANYTALQGDGLQIFFAPVNATLQATTAAGDMASTIHPNDVGHSEIAKAFLYPIKLQAGAPPFAYAPVTTVLRSGTSASYTTPYGALYLVVEGCGGGGGGSGSGTGTPGAGGTGGTTSFSSLSATGGTGGLSPSFSYQGGSGGTATGGDLNLQGGPGGPQYGGAGYMPGGTGGSTYFGSGGTSFPGGGTVVAPGANTCAGGAGGGNSGGGNSGNGGGGAGYFRTIIGTSWPAYSPLAASYTYTVGAGGTAGAAGTANGIGGGAGAAGIIIVTAYSH